MADPRDVADALLSQQIVDLCTHYNLDVKGLADFVAIHTNDVVSCQMYGAADLLVENLATHLHNRHTVTEKDF